MTAQTKALFDPERANKMLKLIRPIVQDMTTEFGRLRQAGRDQRALRVESMHSANSEKKLGALQEEINEESSRIEGYLKELDDLGVEVRDLEVGLIDFPTLIQGKPAYLCWHPSDPEIAFWHPDGKGFDDRQPLPLPPGQ